MGETMTHPARSRAVPRGVARDLVGLAHDLRNVMASLELCAEVMAQPGVLTPGHEYLASEVRSVADAAIGLLRHVGRSTESRAGFRSRWSMTSEAGHGRVAEVLGNMESMLRRVAGPGVHLDVECAPCWGCLAIPAEDLARVLVNLVKNASEALRERGRVRITAQMAGGQSFAVSGQGRQDADAVTISVQDDGPGVPAELAQHLFEPGFSTKQPVLDAAWEDRAWCRLDTGRGLGLAVARELVEMAGGALVLAPSARGARFEMEIPLTNVMRPWVSRRRFDGEGGRA